MTSQDISSQSRFNPHPAKPQLLLRACPVYEATPLVEISTKSGQPMLVKDERNRMGLGAFKALGGVYAVAQLISEAWLEAGRDTLKAEDFLEPEVKAFARAMTFVCASAGNHGLAVAAGAQIFGARARIHLADTVPVSFAERLMAKGAEVVRSGAVYDDAVAAATKDANETGAILLADGSWPGYTHPPALVMEGYTIIAEELRQTFEARGDWPTHVFLQAGVGGLAAAMAHMIRRNWPVQPVLIVVEPDAAPCLRESHAAGKMVRVEGPVSNMGRLDCKEPSLLAFNALEKCDVIYETISDDDVDLVVDYLETIDSATTSSGAAGFAMASRYAASGDMPDPFRPLCILTEAASS